MKIFIKALLFFAASYNVITQPIVEEGDIIEKSNQVMSGTVILKANEKVRLYYSGIGNSFKYTSQGTDYFKASLTYLNYPTTSVTYIPFTDPSQRNPKVYLDENTTPVIPPVGSITGNLNITPTGAAIYSIPIFCPPGTNGVQPNVSLVYNSQSGNSIAGWGWSIDGLSSISRVPKNKFNDGVNDEIKFNNEDKIALNGMRLVKTEGTYGQNGSIYGPLTDNTSRTILKDGDLSNGWFQVESKDLSVIEFGKTNNSKFNTDKGTMAWLVNKVIDANKNYIEYEYTTGNGEMSIYEIRYTGNSDASLIPYAKIKFIYEIREDKNTIYKQGMSYNQSLLLTEIQVFYENDIIRKYTLEYVDDLYSKLHKITEYGKDGGHINSTIFEYYDDSNEIVMRLDENVIDGVPNNSLKTFYGDFNGDGITDRLQAGNILVNGDHYDFKWYMQFGKYYGINDIGTIHPITHNASNYYEFINPESGTYQFSTIGINTEKGKVLYDEVQVIDINKDGFDDVIIPYLSDYDDCWDELKTQLWNYQAYKKLNVKIYVSDGKKLNFEKEYCLIGNRLVLRDYALLNEKFIPGDFDGDGSIEFLIKIEQIDFFEFPDLFGGGSCNMISYDKLYNHIHYANLYLCDFTESDGDLTENAECLRILQFQEKDIKNSPNKFQVYPLNFNGNTKTDFIVIAFPGKSNEYGRVTGIYEYDNELIKICEISDSEFDDWQGFKSNIYAEPPIFADFNGDNLTDVLICKTFNYDIDYIHETWTIKYSNGKKFIEDYTFERPLYSSEYNLGYLATFASVGDFNGDGKADILWPQRSSIDKVQFNIAYSLGTKQIKIRSYNDFIETDCSIKKLWDNTKKMKFIDFNGDGNVDLFFNLSIDHPDWRNTIISLNFNDHSNHLSNIYDGYNNRIEVIYEPMSKGVDDNNNAEPYKKAENIKTNPFINRNGGIYLVSNVQNYYYTEINNQGENILYNSIKYKYEDALFHKDKGFLGFSKFITESIFYNDLNQQNSVKINEIKYFTYAEPDYDIYELSSLKKINDIEVSRNLVVSRGRKNLLFGRYFYINDFVYQYDYLNGIKHEIITPSNRVDDNQNVEYTYTDIYDIYQNQLIAKNSVENIYITKGSFCPNRIDFTTVRNSRAEDGGIYSYETREIDFVYDDGNNKYRLKETISDPYQPKWVKKSYTYNNDFGNITRTDIIQGDQNISNRFSTSTFDSKGRFVLTNSNALGHTTQNTYNNYDGTVASQTDIYGKTTNYYYDEFSRLEKTISPLGLEVQTQFRWSSITGDPQDVLYVKEIKSDYAPTDDSKDYATDSKIYYNSLGRELYSESESFKTGAGNKLIRIKTDYLNDGRIKQKSYPYEYIEEINTQPSIFIETVYNDTLRPWKTIDNGRLTEISYFIDADPSKTAVQTPDGKNSIKVNDPTGLIIESYDNEGNKVKYEYYNNGKIKKISTVGLNEVDANIVEMNYDIYGNQIFLDDPDAGEYTYSYNAFGELVSETNPNGTSSYKYDILGRITEKNTPEGDIYYTYITSGNGLGNISQISGPGSMNVTYTYDDFGRILTKTETIDDTYITTFEYDANYGFLTYKTYPSGVKVEYKYDEIGTSSTMTRVDGNHNENIWELKETDEFGKTIKFQLADGKIETTYGFDTYEFPNSIFTEGTSNSSTFQNLVYDFNENNGNLISRECQMTHQSETFTYDDNDRLGSISIDNNTEDLQNQLNTKTMNYYNDGCIDNKPDVGTYYYDSNGDGTGDLSFPNHAVKKVYGIDGSPISHDDQTLIYTSFNSILTIIEGDGNNKKMSIFKYGYDKQRRKMEYYITNNNNLQYSKYYAGSCEKTIYPDNSFKTVTYISGGDGIVAQIVDSSNVPEKTYYIHTDHLGSVAALTTIDGNGNVNLDAYFNYDAWGRMRNSDDWTDYTVSSATYSYFNIAGRGYTGHEHMNEYALINMNGRLYDPVLAQFLQPDNYIQVPDYAQSYNRFAYCLNNPLKYTDPSGEFLWLIPIVLVGTPIVTSFVKDIVLNIEQDKSINRWGFTHTQNSIKIIGGLFETDPNRTWHQRTWQLISRFTWELPQTTIGYCYSQGINISYDDVQVKYWGGATIVNRNDGKYGHSGVSLGNYINVSNYKEDELNPATNNHLAHEYGHYLQSQDFGLFYLPIIGLQSAFGQLNERKYGKDKWNHSFEWYEVEANQRAYKYLNSKGYDVSKWRNNDFPREQRNDTWSFWSSVFYLNWFFALGK